MARDRRAAFHVAAQQLDCSVSLDCKLTAMAMGSEAGNALSPPLGSLSPYSEHDPLKHAHPEPNEDGTARKSTNWQLIAIPCITERRTEDDWPRCAMSRPPSSYIYLERAPSPPLSSISASVSHPFMKPSFLGPAHSSTQVASPTAVSTPGWLAWHGLPANIITQVTPPAANCLIH